MSARSGKSDLAEGVSGSYVEGHSAWRFLIWVWSVGAWGMPMVGDYYVKYLLCR